MLDDSGLRVLMERLLVAEAERMGADLSQVTVNTEDTASDEGSDAWTPKPLTSGPWLGSTEICWQFKTGRAGQPAKLRGETRKPIPRRTLQSGGAFVLLDVGATSGISAKTARLAALRADARKGRLRTSAIRVVGPSELSTWLNQFPALAAGFRGLSPQFLTIDEWAAIPEHRDQWVSEDAREAQISQLRNALAPTTGAVKHAHVHGRPGVGKSRVVLEACRLATWRRSVLYAPQATVPDISRLMSSVNGVPGAQITIVVDEVLPGDVRPLGTFAAASGERVRLITIGHEVAELGEQSVAVQVHRLGDAAMAKLIFGMNLSLPIEHVDYIVKISEGYVRLARLVAQAVAKDPSTTTDVILKSTGIRHLLDRMLGQSEDRKALYVVALMATVGWNGVHAAEGEAISRHLGFDWSVVRADVHRLNQRYGIAPEAGDLRYISPTPLALMLAIDAVETYRDLVRTLPTALPTESARNAHYERMNEILATPAAISIATDELSQFLQLVHFLDPNAAMRWATFAQARPAIAAANVRAALMTASVQERRGLQGKSRRAVVEQLVRLARTKDAFHDAVLSLALLAEAENETWSNNAGGEFVSRFQIVLSGTDCPYDERLPVIDAVIDMGSMELLSLAILALTNVSRRYGFGYGSGSLAPGPPSPVWAPQSAEEYQRAVAAAVARLVTITRKRVLELLEPLGKAVSHMADLLLDELARDQVVSFLEETVLAYPSLKDTVRQEIHRRANIVRRARRPVEPPKLEWLDELERRFEDQSLGGRLRGAVTDYDLWEDPTHGDSLAQELRASPNKLWENWSWLTSGEARMAWDLGQALGRCDPAGELTAAMLRLPQGRDLRVLCGYLDVVARNKAPGWVDFLLENWTAATPAAQFEVTWRCAPTSLGAERIVRLVNDGAIDPRVVAQLTYGRWTLGPDVGSLRRLLLSLDDKPGTHDAMVAMIDSRLDDRPEDLAPLADIAARLAQDVDLIRGDTMTEYHWERLASRFVGSHPRELSAAILRAHGMRENRDSWFLQHELASGILDGCVKSDPAAVWEELRLWLENDVESAIFLVGFPIGIFDYCPREAVLTWIAEKPDERGALLARVVVVFGGDESLGAQILERYRSLESVSRAFGAAIMSGSGTGRLSDRWSSLIKQLDLLAEKTLLAGVRQWARSTAAELRPIEEAERKREAEEQVRGFGR